MAAEMLAAAGLGVTVYERMPSPARKLLMAGRGGLNLTHSETAEPFLARYGAAQQRLAPAIRAFPPTALRAWCEGLGQETFVGTSGRVFPRAFKASPLLRAWLARLGALGVRHASGHRWVGWTAAGELAFSTAEGSKTARPDATLLALGGGSWPRLGTDGGWTAILSAAGIPITPLAPANCGFTVDWSPVFRERFAGEPLKRIALAFGGAHVRGEAVITAQGLEGGAVYALSSVLRDAIARDGEAVLYVDLRPDLDLGALARRLGRARGGQSTATFLRKAAGLPPVGVGLLREAAGPALPQGAQTLAALVKAAPLHLSGPCPIERAISTAGGIRFDAVDDAFMLRARPGVFVAGEMLDWEAPTGGYLLQGAFATGVAAARGILAHLGRPVPPAANPPW
ncbi:TIGR03862 family flavoprotein [Chelatococcus albus]